jgi:hypothetical protein
MLYNKNKNIFLSLLKGFEQKEPSIFMNIEGGWLRK